jgi:hypothetical protein
MRSSGKPGPEPRPLIDLVNEGRVVEPNGCADQDFFVEGTMMAVLEATIRLQEMLNRGIGLDPHVDE